MSGKMAKIDEQITVVMREMARRRWAKTTPEERRQYAQFLVSTRRKSRIEPIKPVVPDADEKKWDEAFADPRSPRLLENLSKEAGAVLCFRCESGFHERCLDNDGYLACYCKRTLKHQSPGGEYR